jgi:ATP-dependent exoDNAse (exonuclease V) alpha subunit
MRLANMKDPLFDREKLDQAIIAEEKVQNLKFSDQQRRVFDLLEYRFGVVQGDAGTGKSTIMAVQRRYCDLTGRKIAGFATSQLAAEGLGKKAGIDAKNTARAQALESARGEEMIAPNSRAILDESSMLSLESVKATLMKLEAKGAGGLFIGDEAQLPNLAAGDTGRLLASVAKAAGRYTEVTQVYRQKVGSEVEWMRKAIPEGRRAIIAGDSAGFRAYLEEFIDRGHVKFHANRMEEIASKAHDVVEAVKQGKSVLAPGYSHPECLYANRAIRTELGHDGTGINFRLDRGVREISPNDRVIFGKNEERVLGVLNGYLGTVISVTPKNIEVKLDGDNADGSKKIVNVNPAKYRYLEYGWATTTHKSQGRGDPLVVPTLGKCDDARSAHVAVTRCETELHVHTKLNREELLDHLCSANSMRPKDDVLFFDELVRQTGGPDTYWAQSVRTAMEKENDPLREEHRAETRLRVEARQRELTDTLTRFKDQRAQAPNAGALKRVEREEKKELDNIFKRHELESFVSWASRRRMTIERGQVVAEERKQVMKPQVQAVEAPAVKKGRGR